MKTLIKVRRTDRFRALLTDTLPFETPLCFPARLIYEIVKQHTLGATKFLDVAAGICYPKKAQKSSGTTPYKYKVRKSIGDFRRLWLLHPSAQVALTELYESYAPLIIHYCSRSRSSIRAPNKVAGSYFEKGNFENIHKYRSGAVALEPHDFGSRHAPSYFSYRGFDRLYKFFDSDEFIQHERRFPVLMKLDVTKCFDSIYTHSISWALKSKRHAKLYKHLDTTFGDAFDSTIRWGNANETNGIPIGPEASRVFAEIILQEVDARAVTKLRKENLLEHIVIRRYVDDIFIFALNESSAEIACGIYSDCLLEFNLHVNAAKKECSRRPFSTDRSRLAALVIEKATSFLDEFLSLEGDQIFPRPTRRSIRIKRLLQSVKHDCAECGIGYDGVSSMLISMMNERIKQLVEIDPSTLSADSIDTYEVVLCALLETSFFFYSAAPAVSASYKLAMSVLLAVRFSKQFRKSGSQALYHLIYSRCQEFLQLESVLGRSPHSAELVNLEAINILLAMRELPAQYCLPENLVARLFLDSNEPSYFSLSSCLHFVRSNLAYVHSKSRVLSLIRESLSDLTDVDVNAEKAYLFLEMLGCPEFSIDEKARWMSNVAATLQLAKPSRKEVKEGVEAIWGPEGALHWESVDLLTALEKKELKRAY